jgi:chromosome segregation ATPase
LQAANEALTASARKTAFQLEALEAARKKLSADRDAARDECRQASAQLASLADALDAAERKAEQMQKDSGRADGKSSALSARVEELRATLTEKTVDLRNATEGASFFELQYAIYAALCI